MKKTAEEDLADLIMTKRILVRLAVNALLVVNETLQNQIRHLVAVLMQREISQTFMHRQNVLHLAKMVELHSTRRAVKKQNASN
jgi:hypothetical protein